MDVAAADTAQLRVRVTGSVQFDEQRTVRIADLMTSVQTAGLAARLDEPLVSANVQPGSPLEIPLLARNTGQAVWLPDSPSNPGSQGAVGVAARSWITPDGKSMAATGTATHVPWDVEPGQVVPLSVRTSAPTTPGRYRLSIDMLSEKVSWFGDIKGNAALEVPIDVEP
jgi:hypothetical protein